MTSTAKIRYPNGQHASTGKSIAVEVIYTGDREAPTDLHVCIKQTDEDDSDWIEQLKLDVPPGVVPANGVPLSVPVGHELGSFDLRIDWTWPGRREVGTKDGQFYVDRREDPASPGAPPAEPAIPSSPQPSAQHPVIDLALTEYGKFVEKTTGQPLRLVLVRCGFHHSEVVTERVEVRVPTDPSAFLTFDKNKAKKQAELLVLDKLQEAIDARAAQIHCVPATEPPTPSFPPPDAEIRERCERVVERRSLSIEHDGYWEFTPQAFVLAPPGKVTFREVFVATAKATALVWFKCIET